MTLTSDQVNRWRLLSVLKNRDPDRPDTMKYVPLHSETHTRGRRAVAWQDLGLWHIGRSQVMASKHGHEFYHDDVLNSMQANHAHKTFQPVFERSPHRETPQPSCTTKRQLATAASGSLVLPLATGGGGMPRAAAPVTPPSKRSSRLRASSASASEAGLCAPTGPRA